MPQVHVGDSVVDFPDSMSDEEIKAAIDSADPSEFQAKHQKHSLASYFTERLPQLAKDFVTGTAQAAKEAVMAPRQAYEAGASGAMPSIESMIAPSVNMALTGGMVPNKFGLTADIGQHALVPSMRPEFAGRGVQEEATAANLEKMLDKQYETVRASDARAPVGHGVPHAQAALDEMKTSGLDMDSKAAKTMQDYNDPFRAPKVSDLLRDRRTLNGQELSPEEAIAQRSIDSMLEGLPGDAGQIADMAREAPQNYKALQNYNRLKYSERRAELSANENKAKAYQNQIRNMLTPNQFSGTNKFLPTLSPELQGMMEDYTKGSTNSRVASGLRTTLGGSFNDPGLGLVGAYLGHSLDGLLGGAAGYLGGHVLSSVLRKGANSVARDLDLRGAQQGITDLQHMALGEAPAGSTIRPGPMQGPPPPPAGLLPPPGRPIGAPSAPGGIQVPPAPPSPMSGMATGTGLGPMLRPTTQTVGKFPTVNAPAPAPMPMLPPPRGPVPGQLALPPPAPLRPPPAMPPPPEVIPGGGPTLGQGALNPYPNIPAQPPRLKVEIRVPMRDATGRFVKNKLKPKKEEE